MNIFKQLAIGLGKSADVKPVFGGGGTNFFASTNRSFARKDYYYGIVYSCIDAIANAVASNHYGVYKKGKDQSEELTHPIVQLLDKPNDFQTGVDLFYLVSSHIDTHGQAFLYPVKNLGGSIIKEMYVLDPACVSIVRGTDKMIAGYVFTNPKGARIPFDVTEIVPIFRPNPYDQLQGVSTIEMSRRAINADLNAQNYNNAFFENGASPSGALSTENTLGKEQFERLKEQFNDEYKGVANAHKTLLLENGLKYQAMQLSQKDMDFVNQRNLTRDEILSIFKVPKAIVAITDDVNRANAETSDYIFMSRVVKPRIELIFEKLNRFLLPMFANTQNLEIVPDDCVPENQEAELNCDKSAINVWETVNEVRQRRGLEPIDGGDELTPPATPFTFSMGKDLKHKHVHTKMLMTKTAKDRNYLREKKRLMAKSRIELQNKMKQQIKLLVKDIKQKDLSRLRVKGVEDNLTDIIGSTDEWRTLTGQIVYDSSLSAFKRSIELTASYYNLIEEFDLEKSGALAILRSRANDTATSVRDTLLQTARSIIENELAGEDTNLRKIRDAVANGLDDITDANAERIARTEMSYSWHEGATADMKASGLVDKVKWILGDESCDLCESIASTNDGIYDLGDEPQLPAHPNCECDTVPYFD